MLVKRKCNFQVFLEGALGGVLQNAAEQVAGSCPLAFLH